MDTALAMMLQMIVAVIAGISAQVLGDFLRIPSIVFLLTLGILLGNDVLGLLHPQELGDGLEVLVALSVALILFEGGLNLELRNLTRVSGSLRNLVTLGTLITLVGAGMAAHWFAEFPWAIAFLYGSLVVVTGPTVISPLLKQVQVDRPVAALLEGESVLIDPVGAILAVVVLDVILNGDADPLSVIGGLFLRLGIGAGIGAIGGLALEQVLLRGRFLSNDLKNLVVLAGVWGLFGVAQLIRSEAGLMTAVVAGLVLRAADIPDERPLRRFKGQLTILAVSVLFIMLSADLSLASLFALGKGALLTVVILMLVVRPLSVWACTLDNEELHWRQKLFLAWVAPRGIVSASVASLFAILLTERGITGGDAIKALVFLTIISTVFVQGLSARWVAQLLGINEPGNRGLVIVGGHPLGRLIGRLFQEEGESVVLIDTDLQNCREAELVGLQTIPSSAFDNEVLEEAGLENAGTFLVATTNGSLNRQVAQQGMEEFSPPRVLALLPSDSAATVDPSDNPSSVKTALLPKLPLKAWNRYLTMREVRLGTTDVRQGEERDRQLKHLRGLIDSGRILPLVVQRDDHLHVVDMKEDWKAGDRLLYLYHDPKPELLRRLGGGNPQASLILENISEVEELPPPTPPPNDVPPPPPPDQAADKPNKSNLLRKAKETIKKPAASNSSAKGNASKPTPDPAEPPPARPTAEQPAEQPPTEQPTEEPPTSTS